MTKSVAGNQAQLLVVLAGRVLAIPPGDLAAIAGPGFRDEVFPFLAHEGFDDGLFQAGFGDLVGHGQLAS